MNTRYSTEMILLDGKAGSIVATDGRQMFIGNNIAWPFEESLLIAPPPVLTDVTGRVRIRACPDGFLWHSHPWTVLCKGSEESFPDYETIIPSGENPAARITLNGVDRDQLVRQIKDLTTDDGDAVNVAIGKEVSVAGNGRRIEVAGVEHDGEINIAVRPENLVEAVRLGTDELYFPGPNRPIVATGRNLRYVFMPVHSKASASPPVPATPEPKEEETMTKQENDQPQDAKTPPANDEAAFDLEGLVPRLTTLRDSLKSQTGEITALLKGVRGALRDVQRRERDLDGVRQQLKQIQKIQV